MKKWIFLSLYITTACNYQVNKGASHSTNNASAIAGTDPLSWTLIQKEVLNTCFNCHSGLVQPSLASLADVRQNLTLAVNAALGEIMPPSASGYSPLTLCQKALLSQWANEGAPETSATLVGSIADCKGTSTTPVKPPVSHPPTTTPSPVIDWNLINTKVIVACTGCHGSTFNTYSSASKKISTILDVTLSNKMPPNGPLSKCQKTLLQQWANSGTPNTTAIPVSDFKECAGF